MKVQSLSSMLDLYDVEQLLSQGSLSVMHYSTEQALSELEDLLQANHLYKFSMRLHNLSR